MLCLLAGLLPVKIAADARQGGNKLPGGNTVKDERPGELSVTTGIIGLSLPCSK